MPGPHLKRLAGCVEQECTDVFPRVPNTEKTFFMTPFSQERHFLPLESSPTSWSLCVLSPHALHWYS